MVSILYCLNKIHQKFENGKMGIIGPVGRLWLNIIEVIEFYRQAWRKAKKNNREGLTAKFWSGIDTGFVQKPGPLSSFPPQISDLRKYIDKVFNRTNILA